MKTSTLTLLALSLLAAACGGSGPTAPRHITGYRITPATASLLRGDTIRVYVVKDYATGAPDSLAASQVGWSFSRGGVFTAIPTSSGGNRFMAAADTGSVVVDAYIAASATHVQATYTFRTPTPTTPIGIRFAKHADTTTVGTYYALNYTVTLANGTTGTGADIYGGGVHPPTLGYFTAPQGSTRPTYTQFYTLTAGSGWVVLALSAATKDSLYLTVLSKP